ncbi:MAG: HPF/RaiA family ribosome-associated protein [Clostridia bacterium]|nr:HPF/RaiA family ribosome-associated protein [Clostridia bacterium]
MYTFHNTSDKIIEREGVIKQLAKLETTNAKVEINRVLKNNKNLFTCKVSEGIIVRMAEGNTPEAACDNACDAFISAIRKSKDKKVGNAISRRRNTKQEILPVDEVVDEDANNI